MSIYNLQRFVYTTFKANVSFDTGLLIIVADIHLLVILHIINWYTNIILLIKKLYIYIYIYMWPSLQKSTMYMIFFQLFQSTHVKYQGYITKF